MEAPNNNSLSIVQLHNSLSIGVLLHNKAAVVTKNVCKSICLLGVQDTAGALIIMLITQAADAINFGDLLLT